jgi:hypothetical protein
MISRKKRGASENFIKFGVSALPKRAFSLVYASSTQAFELIPRAFC